MRATWIRAGWITILSVWGPGQVTKAAVTATQPAAGAENPTVWQPRTKSVAVFKNGLGFFMREGGASLHHGWCNTGQVPPATFGALAFYSLTEGTAVDVVGAGAGEIVDFDGRDMSKNTTVKRERLQACVNMRVCLSYTHAGGNQSAIGKLLSLGGEYVILQADPHHLAVPIEEVTRLQVLDSPLRIHVAGGPDEPDAKADLGMAYLRQGITWIPEYTLKILDDQTAELTLRGTVVNEAEDLIHCDMHFVVGVPHFLHSDRLAPFAIGQVLRTIGASIVPAQVLSQLSSNGIVASCDNLLRSNLPDRPAAPEPRNVDALLASLPNMDGPAGGDYTVYTKKDLTIRQGEKAIVTLFTQKIGYSHLYRWTPPTAMQHVLVLNNETDTAWTTGPCLALSGDRPLSEDLLRYTPKKGACEIPVTTAINMLCEKQESEVNRKLKAHEPAHDFFADLVELRGELSIRNLDKSEVTVVIENPVSGKPISASDGGTLRIDTAKLQLLERSGSIAWRLRIAPGENKTLTYTCERYVPSK